MQPFTTLNGLVAPMDRANVDTDAIIPKQFLKSIKRSGYGVYLFDEWRYLDHGEPGMACSNRPLNSEFVLNQPQYDGASVLLTRKNFGCGSSREHAPWALEDYGFRCIISPSFADIFYNNCFKNGMLPIVQPDAVMDQLFAGSINGEGYHLQIDLPAQQITTADGTSFSFEIDPFRKTCLLKGLDDIDLTLQHADEIHAFEEKHLAEMPWLIAA